MSQRSGFSLIELSVVLVVVALIVGVVVTGTFVTRDWHSCTDASPNGSDLGADYLLSGSDKLCALIFERLF